MGTGTGVSSWITSAVAVGNGVTVGVGAAVGVASGVSVTVSSSGLLASCASPSGVGVAGAGAVVGMRTGSWVGKGVGGASVVSTPSDEMHAVASSENALTIRIHRMCRAIIRAVYRESRFAHSVSTSIHQFWFNFSETVNIAERGEREPANANNQQRSNAANHDGGCQAEPRGGVTRLERS